MVIGVQPKGLIEGGLTFKDWILEKWRYPKVVVTLHNPGRCQLLEADGESFTTLPFKDTLVSKCCSSGTKHVQKVSITKILQIKC